MIEVNARNGAHYAARDRAPKQPVSQSVVADSGRHTFARHIRDISRQTHVVTTRERLRKTRRQQFFYSSLEAAYRHQTYSGLPPKDRHTRARPPQKFILPRLRKSAVLLENRSRDERCTCYPFCELKKKKGVTQSEWTRNSRPAGPYAGRNRARRRRRIIGSPSRSYVSLGTYSWRRVRGTSSVVPSAGRSSRCR